MNNPIEITVKDFSGNEIPIDLEKYREAHLLYKSKISELHNAEDEEIATVNEKYKTILNEVQAERDDLIQQRNDFEEYWDHCFAGYKKDRKKLEKTIKKMHSEGVPLKELEKFTSDEYKILNEKHKNVWDEYEKDKLDFQPVFDSIDKYNLELRQNTEIVEYKKEVDAITKKYRKLRKAIPEPRMYDFIKE